jgi:hypothetical protein
MAKYNWMDDDHPKLLHRLPPSMDQALRSHGISIVLRGEERDPSLEDDSTCLIRLTDVEATWSRDANRGGLTILLDIPLGDTPNSEPDLESDEK